MTITNTQPVSYETEVYKKTELRPNLEYFLIPPSKSTPDHYKLFKFSTREITLIENDVWELEGVRVNWNNSTRAFYNSKENPVVLSFNKFKDFLYTKEVVTYIAVTEFKDTGKFVFTCCVQEFCYSSKTNTLFLRKNGKKFINLYIDKETFIPTVYVNGKLCYTDYHLANSLNTLMDLRRPGFEFFSTPFNQRFLCDLNGALIPSNEIFSSNIIKLYRVKRSGKLLKQLPWTNINHLTSLYSYSVTKRLSIDDLGCPPDKAKKVFARHRESVLVSLRKGDTKKAVDKLFFNVKLPKSIKKILIKLPIHTFNYENMLKLEKHLIEYDVNIVRTALELTNNPSYTNIIEIIDLGFSFKHTVNTYKKDYHLLEDTLRYVRYSREELPLVENHTIKEYHDMLDAIRQEEIDRNRYNKDCTGLFEATKSDYIYPPQEVGNYIFRSPNTVSELEQVSSKLKICVRMYQEPFFLRTLDIVLVVDKDTNHYIGCIELKNTSVVQAKLKYNKFLKDDEAVLSATNTWISENNLEINTRDLVDNLVYKPVATPPEDFMRLEMMVAWIKARKEESETARGVRAPMVFIEDNVREHVEENNPW